MKNDWYVKNKEVLSMITLFQLLKFICIFENGYLVSLF